MGLYAFSENFTVSKIDATPIQLEGKTPISNTNATLSMNITNTTTPPTLMVYLPYVNESSKIQVSTNSYGKESAIEVFDGLIQPWETSNWWAIHDLAIRSPLHSIVTDGIDPFFIWEANKSGFYTLVIVLRQGWVENSTVDGTDIDRRFNLILSGGLPKIFLHRSRQYLTIFRATNQLFDNVTSECFLQWHRWASAVYCRRLPLNCSRG